MEQLDRNVANGGSLSQEEYALLAPLERLNQDHDDGLELPEVPPHQILRLPQTFLERGGDGKH